MLNHIAHWTECPLLKIQKIAFYMHVTCCFFVWMGCIKKITWKFCTNHDCVSNCWHGVWSREQSSGEAPVHMYQWRIMAETIASLAFQTYNGIRYQFKFPASFLTSLFSYLVSLKLLKNSWRAAISEMSMEICYFRRTSLITGIYSFLFYFYFLSFFAI